MTPLKIGEVKNGLQQGVVGSVIKWVGNTCVLNSHVDFVRNKYVLSTQFNDPFNLMPTEPTLA